MLPTRRGALARLCVGVAAACTISWLAVGPASAASQVTKTSTPAAPWRILALGDSLTAGYGLADKNDAFPAQLERALIAAGHDVKVLPGGISGDTTTGGLNRLEWALAAQPDAVIVELGANDALRGIDPKLTAQNLRAIVQRIQREGTPVLLTGMYAPPNLGRHYADRFKAIFPAVAKDTGALLYPFFLDGVAAERALNQDDQIHPTAKGVAVIVERILPSVEKLLAQAEKASRQKSPP